MEENEHDFIHTFVDEVATTKMRWNFDCENERKKFPHISKI